MTMTNRYDCPKCGCQACDISEMRATGGFLTKLLDIQSKRFTTVTCRQCRFTELYQASSSMVGNILDFAAGG